MLAELERVVRAEVNPGMRSDFVSEYARQLPDDRRVIRRELRRQELTRMFGELAMRQFIGREREVDRGGAVIRLRAGVLSLPHDLTEEDREFVRRMADQLVGPARPEAERCARSASFRRISLSCVDSRVILTCPSFVRSFAMEAAHPAARRPRSAT